MTAPQPSPQPPLLTTAQLADALADALAGGSPVVVLDTRWSFAGPGREDYRAGHIPGAVFLDLDTDLAGAAGAGGRHPLPEPSALQCALRAAGVTSDALVVAYDAADGSIAARAWWLLRWAGHRRVAVLDGGFATWVAEQRPVSVTVPAPREGDIEVRPPAMPVLDADQAAALAADGVLLDAREPQRYRGESEPVDARPGHIPGARNAPFGEHTDSRHRWRAPAELAERFAGLGVTGAAPVAAYCGSGVTACAVVLALERAGVTDPQHPAGLYVGSWSHWSADPARPAATADDPSPAT